MSFFGLSFGSYVPTLSTPRAEVPVSGDTIGEFIIDDAETYIVTREGEYLFTNTLISNLVDDNDDNIVTEVGDEILGWELFENPETSDEPPVAAPGPSGPSISATGLALWIDGNGDVLDQSPNGLSVSNVNGAGFIAGPGAVNLAVDFQSADSDYLSVTDDPAIRITGDYTVLCYILPDTFASDQGLVDKSNEYQLYYESALGGYMRIRHVTTQYGNTVDDTNDLTTGVWQFLWGRFDAGANTFEHSVNNNTPTTTTGVTVDPASGSSALEIGRKLGSSYLDAAMCMIVIFTRKLTDDELTDLYNGGVQLLYSEINWTA